ncbi:hypothetical protein DITRI_Ditri02bG0001300 [Diplodiscus trichospermus]
MFPSDQQGPIFALESSTATAVFVVYDSPSVLAGCGQALEDNNMFAVAGLIHVLEKMVSVSGEPIQRLGAYVLEGLRARLVKNLSPKVVTLVEQESNTNTSIFFSIYLETLDYYTAMFESIVVACPRNDKQRISAEQHCVACDIVNLIAC